MSAVVKRICQQRVLAEPPGDVIVSTGVFAQPVRENDHRARLDVGNPDVVNDARAADAVEGSFAAGGCHQGQRRPNRSRSRASSPRTRPGSSQGGSMSKLMRKLGRVSVLVEDFAG